MIFDDVSGLEDLVLSEELRKEILAEFDALYLISCSGGQESISRLQEKLRGLETVAEHVREHRRQVQLDSFD